jgi:hypothetical protein
VLNLINGISGFGMLTMKDRTRERWDDESENISRAKCKKERKREKE